MLKKLAQRAMLLMFFCGASPFAIADIDSSTKETEQSFAGLNFPLSMFDLTQGSHQLKMHPDDFNYYASFVITHLLHHDTILIYEWIMKTYSHFYKTAKMELNFSDQDDSPKTVKLRKALPRSTDQLTKLPDHDQQDLSKSLFEKRFQMFYSILTLEDPDEQLAPVIEMMKWRLNASAKKNLFHNKSAHQYSLIEETNKMLSHINTVVGQRYPEFAATELKIDPEQLESKSKVEQALGPQFALLTLDAAPELPLFHSIYDKLKCIKLESLETVEQEKKILLEKLEDIPDLPLYLTLISMYFMKTYNEENIESFLQLKDIGEIKIDEFEVGANLDFWEIDRLTTLKKQFEVFINCYLKENSCAAINIDGCIRDDLLQNFNEIIDVLGAILGGDLNALLRYRQKVAPRDTVMDPEQMQELMDGLKHLIISSATGTGNSLEVFAREVFPEHEPAKESVIVTLTKKFKQLKKSLGY